MKFSANFRNLENSKDSGTPFSRSAVVGHSAESSDLYLSSHRMDPNLPHSNTPVDL